MNLHPSGAKPIHAHVAWLIAALAVTGCAHSLSPPEGRNVTHAIESAADTPLVQATLALAAAHPGLSGIHALTDGRSAFATRGLLIKAAQRTLDIQYYIWHHDETGILLLEALWQAAERGVRVRLLLDDSGTSGLDGTWRRSTAHPNVEVRLYNPMFHRWFKPINYVTDFRRVNRRMHNKSFTADGQATIVGGRNVGNEYFGEGTGTVMADLDVVAIGRVVTEVSGIFDQYWNSQSAYPLERGREATARRRGRACCGRGVPQLGGDPPCASTSTPRGVDRRARAAERRLALEWVETRVLADDPAKTLGRVADEAIRE